MLGQTMGKKYQIPAARAAKAREKELAAAIKMRDEAIRKIEVLTGTGKPDDRPKWVDRDAAAPLSHVKVPPPPPPKSTAK